MTATMRAAVLDETGLAIENIPIPEPRHGEVLLKVAGCGVCHSDLHVVRGGIPYRKPCVLGHETTGTVIAHGPDIPAGTPQVGSPVVCSFVMPCGTCVECERGRDDMCVNFFGVNRTLGTLYDGTSRLHREDGQMLHMFSMSGMAEYAVVPALAVYELPANLPLLESAVLGCAAITAFSAIKNGAGGVKGKSIAIVATGGVGLNLIQLSKLQGAERIIAIDINDDKIKMALDTGATEGVNSAQVDPVEAVMDLTGGVGVDVAFEALGSPTTFVQAFNMARNGGKTVPVGLNLGNVTMPINRMVRAQVGIQGSYGSRVRVDMPEMLRLLSEAQFDPRDLVSSIVPITELGSTLDSLEAGEVRGRAVVDLQMEPAA